MNPRLRRFLAGIAPENLADRVEQAVNTALVSLPLHTAAVCSGTEFREVLTRAWRHVFGHLLGIGPKLPEINADFEWDRAIKLLNSLYGSPNGWKTALELARTGVEGGLCEVVRAFARKAAAEQVERMLSAAVDQFWHSLSFDEAVQIVTEYLREYRHILPADLLERHPVELANEFPKVLREHPEMIQRLRRLTRR